MPHYEVANLVTVTMTNMMDEMPSVHGTLKTTAVGIQLQVSCRAAQQSQLLSKSPTNPRRCLSGSEIWLSEKSNLVASWMHLENCRSIQEHLRILLLSLRELCLAPAGPGSIWKYIEALVRSTGVSGTFACSFRTSLNFADVIVKYYFWIILAAIIFNIVFIASLHEGTKEKGNWVKHKCRYTARLARLISQIISINHGFNVIHYFSYRIWANKSRNTQFIHSTKKLEALIVSADYSYLESGRY